MFKLSQLGARSYFFPSYYRKKEKKEVPLKKYHRFFYCFKIQIQTKPAFLDEKKNETGG